jgi:hypothetical protein
MKLFRFLILVSVVITFVVCAAGQRRVRFSSVYTDFKRGCKTLQGGNGSDNAYLCRGAGRYKVRIYYSAAATHLAAELTGTDKFTPIATLDLRFDYTKTRVEWRLANGKPFAVIYRVPRYAEPKEGEYFGKVIGQRLAVIGLGNVDINETIDARSRTANVRAREMADKAYLAGK